MMEEEREQYREQLRATAERLERWARESVQGGWSTHLVEPCREEAKNIYTLLGRYSRYGR